VDARSEADTEARTLLTTRLFDAPRKLVFAAWTDSKHLAQWWGPNGFTTTTSAFEMKPGGVWRYVMHGPDGTDYQNRITFDEVTPPKRLVYQHGGDGGALDHVQFHVTVTFEEVGHKTQLTMRAVFASAEMRNEVVEKYGAAEGGRQTLERLAAFLAS
jgi:uncharacterized protein YndB with AHSA1/START domain